MIWGGAEPLFPNLLMYWHDWVKELELMTLTSSEKVEVLQAAIEAWLSRDIPAQLRTEMMFLLEVTAP